MVYNSLEHYLKEEFGIEKFYNITKKDTKEFLGKK